MPDSVPAAGDTVENSGELCYRQITYSTGDFQGALSARKEINQDDIIGSEGMGPYYVVMGEGLHGEVAFELRCK